VDVDCLTRLYAERWAVDALTVDEDVTVHHHLASLRRGASEARTKNESVKTHLEQLNEVLTGQSLGATRLVEGVAHLGFTNSVLSAKTLLFAKTHREVTFGLALGTAVLAGWECSFAHEARGLGCQCDSECTR
jgi:hypothetical protein